MAANAQVGAQLSPDPDQTELTGGFDYKPVKITRPLSHVLSDLGFFDAFGTIEQIEHDRREQMERDQRMFVGISQPMTWGDYNDVFVICDEHGHPWVIASDKLALGDWDELTRCYHLIGGAYVPHSSDGGRFIGEILPHLLAGETLQS